jgi:adenine-specific DNA-methyltransferase
MDYDQVPRSTLIAWLQERDRLLAEAGQNGIVMNYTGRTAPWQIIRLVKPKLSRIIKRLSVGDETTQSENELWDGENLSAMVTLYKYRGQVDLILTDPLTTQAKISVIMTSGTKTRTIRTSANSCLRTTGLATASGYAS